MSSKTTISTRGGVNISTDSFVEGLNISMKEKQLEIKRLEKALISLQKRIESVQENSIILVQFEDIWEDYKSKVLQFLRLHLEKETPKLSDCKIILKKSYQDLQERWSWIVMIEDEQSVKDNTFKEYNITKTAPFMPVACDGNEPFISWLIEHKHITCVKLMN